MTVIRTYTELLGKTFDKVEVVDGDKMYFIGKESSCRFYHEQDCCEEVRVEEIIGDLSDLVGSPILQAEEVTESGSDGIDDTYTWTFYKFATAKGFVTVRWLGRSNSFYSEAVDFEEVKEGKKHG